MDLSDYSNLGEKASFWIFTFPEIARIILGQLLLPLWLLAEFLGGKEMGRSESVQCCGNAHGAESAAACAFGGTAR